MYLFTYIFTIHKKDPTKKLNNLPTNFVESFYKDWLGGIDFSEDTDFQQSIVNKTPSEDVKKFLLTTSDFGNEIQGELNLYRMDGKLNSAIFRRKLDPISKNVIRNESPIEFLFKNLKHFDAQNPVIGNLIKEIDIGKKKDLSKILKGAPGIIDLELMLRLNRVRDDKTFNADRNNNNDNNNNNLPPTPPPAPYFLPNFGPDQLPQSPPSLTIFLDQQHLQQVGLFLHNLFLQLTDEQIFQQIHQPYPNHLRLIIF